MILNRYFYHRLGRRVIGGLVPVLEETLKSSTAWLLGASLIGTHGFFGLIECLWDLFQPGQGHWPSALMGLVSHLIFGLLTQWIFQQTGVLFWGILVAGMVHIAWNSFVLYLDQRQTGWW